MFGAGPRIRKPVRKLARWLCLTSRSWSNNIGENKCGSKYLVKKTERSRFPHSGCNAAKDPVNKYGQPSHIETRAEMPAEQSFRLGLGGTTGTLVSHFVEVVPSELAVVEVVVDES